MDSHGLVLALDGVRTSTVSSVQTHVVRARIVYSSQGQGRSAMSLEHSTAHLL